MQRLRRLREYLPGGGLRSCVIPAFPADKALLDGGEKIPFRPHCSSVSSGVVAQRFLTLAMDMRRRAWFTGLWKQSKTFDPPVSFTPIFSMLPSSQNPNDGY